MNQQQLLLTQLLGSKELTFGCLLDCAGFGPYVTVYGNLSITDKVSVLKPTLTGYTQTTANISRSQIIGYPATETDFKRWLNENVSNWKQDRKGLSFNFFLKDTVFIPYDSSKDLLEQSTETLALIIELIRNNQ